MECHKCLENRVKQLREDSDLKSKVEDSLKMEFEDFIDMGRAYFFEFSWIDSWTGVGRSHRKYN